MDVNLWGTLQLSQLVAKQMKEQGDGGRIVMTNSMSAVRIQERFGAYTASKAALAAATKTLAKELGRFGIRVNAVHPGYIWGDSVEQYFRYQADKRGITFEERYQEVAAETSLGLPAPLVGDRRRRAVPRFRPGQAHHRPGAARQRRPLVRRVLIACCS